MAQFNNVVIKDASNADHTYKPFSSNGGVATWIESTGVPLGDRKITGSTVRTQGGRLKTTLKLQIPVVQDATVNGITRPTVVRTAYADVVFSFDGGSAQLERHDMISLVISLLAKTGPFEMARDGEAVF